jgi:hypothetical protein
MALHISGGQAEFHTQAGEVGQSAAHQLGLHPCGDDPAHKQHHRALRAEKEKLCVGKFAPVSIRIPVEPGLIAVEITMIFVVRDRIAPDRQFHKKSEYRAPRGILPCLG